MAPATGPPCKPPPLAQGRLWGGSLPATHQRSPHQLPTLPSVIALVPASDLGGGAAFSPCAKGPGGGQPPGAGDAAVLKPGWGSSHPSLSLPPPPEIVLPSTYQTHVGGLCGNYDGRRNNEYMKPDGQWTRSLNAFGDSWRVSAQGAARGGRAAEAGGHPRARSAPFLQPEGEAPSQRKALLQGWRLGGRQAGSSPAGPGSGPGEPGPPHAGSRPLAGRDPRQSPGAALEAPSCLSKSSSRRPRALPPLQGGGLGPEQPTGRGGCLWRQSPLQWGGIAGQGPPQGELITG